MARTPEQKKKDADYQKAKRARERANGTMLKRPKRQRTPAQKEKDKLYRREQAAQARQLKEENEDLKRQLETMSARKTPRQLTHGSPATSASGRSDALSILSSALKQHENENETLLSAQRTRELEASAAKQRADSEHIHAEMMLSAQKERQGYVAMAQKLLEEENGPKQLEESFNEEAPSDDDDRKPSPVKKSTDKKKEKRCDSSSSSSCSSSSSSSSVDEDRKPSPKKKPSKKTNRSTTMAKDIPIKAKPSTAKKPKPTNATKPPLPPAAHARNTRASHRAATLDSSQKGNK